MLVAGGYDPRALATIDWLASRHDVPVSAYTVAMVRFGGERLLSVRREPADAGRARQRGRLAALGRHPRRPSAHAEAASTPKRRSLSVIAGHRAVAGGLSRRTG